MMLCYMLLGGVVYMLLGLVIVGFIGWLDGIAPTDAKSIFLLWPLALVFIMGAGLGAAFAMAALGIVSGVARTLINLEARGRGGKKS